MRFAIFRLHLSKYCACHEKVIPGHTKCCTCHAKSSQQTWRSDAPKCNPPQESSALTSYISDQHVSCTAPATENASLQILFTCPTPAIVFGNATKSSRFAHFWQGALSLAPATQNDIWTSKSGPSMWHVHMLTTTCASRHNGVHFFDISTSKSGPNLVRFVHFDFEMCFAPQRRALFRHLNFQKWSEPGVLCTFWLRNVLRATTVFTFSTSQLPKVVREWCVFYILTSKCASRQNGVQFFISHLARWLRTRRFSEPTFRPSRASNHRKNTVFRDFPTFARTWIFFLLRLSLFWSSFFFSSLLFSDSSHLCFSSVILSEVWLLNFVRWLKIVQISCKRSVYIYIVYIYIFISIHITQVHIQYV